MFQAIFLLRAALMLNSVLTHCVHLHFIHWLLKNGLFVCIYYWCSFYSQITGTHLCLLKSHFHVKFARSGTFTSTVNILTLPTKNFVSCGDFSFKMKINNFSSIFFPETIGPNQVIFFSAAVSFFFFTKQYQCGLGKPVCVSSGSGEQWPGPGKAPTQAALCRQHHRGPSNALHVATTTKRNAQMWSLSFL